MTASAIEHDVLIAGAGPAGSIAALELARAGRRVLLCDAASFPRDKTCGEGILPGGVRALEELGLVDDLLAAGARKIDALRFHSSDSNATHLLPLAIERPEDHGLALSRFRFDDLLLGAARAAGAEILTETRILALEDDGAGVTAIVAAAEDPGGARFKHAARFAIVAAGSAHAIEHRRNGALITRRPPRAERFGLSAHIPDLHESNEVDIFLENSYEIYTSSVEPGRRLVSILCETRIGKDMFRDSGRREGFARLVSAARTPEWLRAAPEKILGAGIPSLPAWRRPRYGDGLVLRAGDACAVTDPVAAQGISLAILSGRAAAATIAAALDRDSSRDLVASDLVFRYASTVDPLFRRSLRTARGLLRLARHPELAATALPILADDPAARPIVADGLGVASPLSTARFFFTALAAARRTRVFDQRIDEPEVMDRMAPSELPESTWILLDRANRWFSGDRTVFDALKSEARLDASRRTIIVDIGGGDGTVAARLASRWTALHRGVPPPLAICVEPRIPAARSHRLRDRVAFVAADIRRLPFRTGAIDFVTASLVFHHLHDADHPAALGECSRIARFRVVVNDLIRRRAAWLATALFTAACGDAVTRIDGPLSVRRAFTEEEVLRWTAAAPRFEWTFRAHFFYRFTLTGVRAPAP